MKRVAVVLTAVGLFVAMPAFAAEHEGMMMNDDDGMRQCALQAETIQKKIERIQGEIKKGSKKYTPEQLKKLNDKLKEANDILDDLNRQ